MGKFNPDKYEVVSKVEYYHDENGKLRIHRKPKRVKKKKERHILFGNFIKKLEKSTEGENE